VWREDIIVKGVFFFFFVIVFKMNDLLVYDRNGTSLCDSWTILVCAIVANGLHRSYSNKFFNCPQHCKNSYNCSSGKCNAQKLGLYLLTFVNLNSEVNPDVAYVYV
jgi:hypothetical protein